MSKTMMISLTGGGAGIHVYGQILAEGDDVYIGGQADILYSSLALARLAEVNPYQVTSWRER